MINTKFDVECRSSTAFEKKSFEPCDRNIGMSGSHCMKRLPVSEGSCSGEVVLCGWIRAGLIIAVFWDYFG